MESSSIFIKKLFDVLNKMKIFYAGFQYITTI